MNKFQDVDFRSIGDFLDYLPPDEGKIVARLRAIIFQCIPDVSERLAYNVPFYYRHGRICFIWPASVPWGKIRKKGVELGFCKGCLLPDTSYLTMGSRKEVSIKTFFSTKEIDVDRVRQLLYEAVVIDEMAVSKKRPKTQ